MDDNQLLNSVIKPFVDAPTLQDARVILENNQSVLLTDQADRILQTLILAMRMANLPIGKDYMPGGGNYLDHLERRRVLLKRCRTVGIASAWAEYARAYPR